MGVMVALPAGKNFNETDSVGSRSDVYPRQSETLNHPGIGHKVRSDALDTEHGFASAQRGR